MKKVLMITTGGTIAGLNSGFGIRPSLSGEKLRPDIEGIETTVLDLFSIDSTDIMPIHWRRMYKAINENLPLYDGIVILHGTDTMAYTGAVLAFTTETDKPVILTGAILPPYAEDSDAPTNIENAVRIAAEGEYKGVYLAFGGRVISGGDIVKVSSTEKDAFRSYSGFVPRKKYKLPERTGQFPAVVRLTPFTYGLDIMAIAQDRAGIVIETYGAGGIPDNEITLVLSELSKTMPVIITTPCFGGTDLGRYEVGRRALDVGGVDADKRSTECAAVEIWLSMNQ
ncbi:MAG: asparaginase [Ruminiclostridium sp.]|nr:asparaginase [Ruminiclostridium sp.]